MPAYLIALCFDTITMQLGLKYFSGSSSDSDNCGAVEKLSRIKKKMDSKQQREGKPPHEKSQDNGNNFISFSVINFIRISCSMNSIYIKNIYIHYQFNFIIYSGKTLSRLDLGIF